MYATQLRHSWTELISTTLSQQRKRTPLSDSEVVGSVNDAELGGAQAGSEPGPEVDAHYHDGGTTMHSFGTSSSCALYGGHTMDMR